MKTSLSTLAFLLPAVLALPAKDDMTVKPLDVCGSNSNCERIDPNGVETYRFKPGFEPGSADYSKRFSGLEKRQAPLSTKVILGKTRIQYGCGSNVWDQVRVALDENCMGGCDGGTKKEYDVKQWNGGKRPSDAKLGIKASSLFLTEETRNILVQAVLAAINKDTVTIESKWWEEAAGSGAMNYGMQDAGGYCSETIFSNFVSVQRFDGENMRDGISFEAEMTEVESKSLPPVSHEKLYPPEREIWGNADWPDCLESCVAENILKSIASGINGIAGEAYGTIATLCQEGKPF